MGEKEDVQDAVKLLQLRDQSSRNMYARMALERRINALPERIRQLAKQKMEGKQPAKQKPSSKGGRATLQKAELNTTFMQPNGHQMEFRLTAQMPKKQGDIDQSEIPKDLFGVYFEWWEEIVYEYDFKEPQVDPTNTQAVNDREQRIADKKEAGEGGSTKPWSDIYLSNPQSQTFNTWKATLRQAGAGELSGAVVTGLEDRPALSASPDSFRKRILRFRINAGDDNGDGFKADAIQVIIVEDGQVVSTVYQDSTGTDLKSGTGESEAMRYRPGVSSEVRGTSAVDFVEAVEGDKKGCRQYDNLEMDQIMSRMGQNDILSQVHKDVNQSNQLNVMPLIPQSDEYWEYDASEWGAARRPALGRQGQAPVPHRRRDQGGRGLHQRSAAQDHGADVRAAAAQLSPAGRKQPVGSPPYGCH